MSSVIGIDMAISAAQAIISLSRGEWPAEKVARILGLNRGQVFLAKHRILALVKKEIQRLEKEIV